MEANTPTVMKEGPTGEMSLAQMVFPFACTAEEMTTSRFLAIKYVLTAIRGVLVTQLVRDVSGIKQPSPKRDEINTNDAK